MRVVNFEEKTLLQKEFTVNQTNKYPLLRLIVVVSSQVQCFLIQYSLFRRKGFNWRDDNVFLSETQIFAQLVLS